MLSNIGPSNYVKTNSFLSFYAVSFFLFGYQRTSFLCYFIVPKEFYPILTPNPLRKKMGALGKTSCFLSSILEIAQIRVHHCRDYCPNCTDICFYRFSP